MSRYDLLDEGDENGGVFYQDSDGWHAFAYAWLDVIDGDDGTTADKPWFVARYWLDVVSLDDAEDCLQDVTDANIEQEVGWYASREEAIHACRDAIGKLVLS